MGGESGSVVLSDQVKSLDWRARNARRKDGVSADVLAEVRAKLCALIG
jgi:mRNA interferase MazF